MLQSYLNYTDALFHELFIDCSSLVFFLYHPLFYELFKHLSTCYLIVRIPLFYELLIDHSSFCFLFLDRPDPPRYPTCENIRDDSVLLSWKPPLNDGGSFITQYIVEKCEPPNTNWLRVAPAR
jgi:hypothetical protein